MNELFHDGVLRRIPDDGPRHEAVDPTNGLSAAAHQVQERLPDDHVDLLLPERPPRRTEDLRDALVIRSESFSMLTDRDGAIPAGNASGLGLYYKDTRYLSTWELQVQGIDLLPLLSIADLGYAMEQVFVAPPLAGDDGHVVPAGSVQVRRQRVLNGELAEAYQFSNYADVPATLSLVFRFGVDFADIFEVRGLPRPARGRRIAPRVQSNGVIFRFLGLDKQPRQTRIRFRPAPDAIAASTAFFRIVVPARATQQLTATVLADAIAGSTSVRQSTAALKAKRQLWREGLTQVVTDHEPMNAVLDRSLDDVHMLLSTTESGSYVSAGTPWFNTLFGRDAIVSALMLLPFSSAPARGTLRLLAELQGTSFDPRREEQPGKIVHEVRSCETARTGEVPFERYYGSVDATPLFLLLAAEYFKWTGDEVLMRGLRSSFDSALRWIDECGDSDGDGFVEYQKQSPEGLDNQGWKDSHDAIVGEAGALLAPPVAVVEVQGYVYAAKRGMADVLDALGEGDRAADLRRQAVSLRRAINSAYWLKEEGHYGLALDGEKRLSKVVASNGAQLLWCGVPNAAQARKEAERVFRADMYSGWGIRTLSGNAHRYNPLGYHLGTIWPHDNALIAAGLKRYGFGVLADQLSRSLIEAALSFPGMRLPELFSGAARLAHHAPVPYPVACRPQAWAATSVPFVLTSLLGLRPTASSRDLTLLRPRLPTNVQRLSIRNLHVGGASVDFDVVRDRGRISVHRVGRSSLSPTIRRSLPRAA